MLAQRAVAAAHLSDFPAPASVALKQEYVVVVEVRTDAAAGSGVADHHVVDPPAGQEAELLQQLGDFRDELVYRLDQQGPVLFRQVLVVLLLERATAHFPRGFPCSRTMRDSTDSSSDSPASSSADNGLSKSGIAWRTSSGLRCQ